MGPRAGLDGCGKPHPYQDSIPGPSNTLQVSIPTELTRPSAVLRWYLQKFSGGNVDRCSKFIIIFSSFSLLVKSAVSTAGDISVRHVAAVSLHQVTTLNFAVFVG